MRSPNGRYRLSFLVPAGVAMTGGQCALDGGCSIEVSNGVIAIFGPSREAVFERATDVLTDIRQIQPIASISATLQCPAPISGRDGWSIIIGGPIAFSPTSLDPYISRRFFQ